MERKGNAEIEKIMTQYNSGLFIGCSGNTADGHVIGKEEDMTFSAAAIVGNKDNMMGGNIIKKALFASMLGVFMADPNNMEEFNQYINKKMEEYADGEL